MDTGNPVALNSQWGPVSLPAPTALGFDIMSFPALLPNDWRQSPSVAAVLWLSLPFRFRSGGSAAAPHGCFLTEVCATAVPFTASPFRFTLALSQPEPIDPALFRACAFKKPSLPALSSSLRQVLSRFVLLPTMVRSFHVPLSRASAKCASRPVNNEDIGDNSAALTFRRLPEITHPGAVHAKRNARIGEPSLQSIIMLS